MFAGPDSMGFVWGGVGRALYAVCAFCGHLGVYLRVFHPIWVLGARGGGAPKGLVHNLPMQFFTLGSSKIEVFETCFCDTVIT